MTCTVIRKTQLIDYATKYDLKWLEDNTNNDVNRATRNKIRHDMLPSALSINLGLYNMVKKKIVKRTQKQIINKE